MIGLFCCSWLGEGGGWALAVWGLKNARARGKGSGIGTLGWGRGAQALGFRTRGWKAGGGVGKPLEALFPPAVKGRSQKMVI